jgi:hypothetical protein
MNDKNDDEPRRDVADERERVQREIERMLRDGEVPY